MRFAIPILNEERRKKLVKRLPHIVEDHRVAARNIRREANEAIRKLEKDKVISEDEPNRATGEIQTLTNEVIEKLDTAGKAKKHESLARISHHAAKRGAGEARGYKARDRGARRRT